MRAASRSSGCTTFGLEVDGTDGAPRGRPRRARRARGRRRRRPVIAVLDADRVLRADAGRRLDVRAQLAGRVAGAARHAPTSSSRGSRCCARRSTGGRCTSRARSSSATATAAHSTCASRSASTTRARTSATSSPRPATCTSKACSPKPRWPRCRPSSSDAVAAATAGRRRVVVGAHRGRLVSRRASSASTSSRRRCASCSTPTGSAPSARSPTTRWCNGDPYEGDSAEGL